MITLKDFLEVIDYRITGGYEYQWSCFGPNAHGLESTSMDLDNDGEYSVGVVFDTRNQTVYTIEVHDYARQRSYRLINPEFYEAYKKEALRREGCIDNAYDGVNFTDLEIDDDWLSKARAIIAGQNYDDRVKVPVDLDDDEMFKLMKLAHERDITLNQLVAEILEKTIQAEQAK